MKGNNINSKKLVIAGFNFVMALMLFNYSMQAQTAKRIEFEKGKSTATIRGKTGPTGTLYTVRAASGQKLVLTLSPRSKIGIKVERDGRFGHMVLLREERGGRFEVGLEESGDYTILIGPAEHRSIAFTLNLHITRLKDI